MKKTKWMCILLAAGMILASCGKAEEPSHESKADTQKKTEKAPDKNEKKEQTHKTEPQKEKPAAPEPKEDSTKAPKTDTKTVTADESKKTDSAPEHLGDDERWKVKSPVEMPGDQPVLRQHVARLLMNKKLNPKFIHASDVEKGEYVPIDGTSGPQKFANIMLVEGGYVPQVEDAPPNMHWFLLSPSKLQDKTIIGISDTDIVVSTTDIDDVSAATMREKVDYPSMIANEGTQVFKVQDLISANTDTSAMHKLANKIYIVSPHTIQRVPTK